MNTSTTERTIAFILEKDEAKDLLAAIEAGLSTKYLYGLQFSLTNVIPFRDELTKFVGEEV